MRAKNLILTKHPSSNFDKEQRVVKLLFGLAHQDNMTKHNREGKFFFDICSCGMTKSYTCYYYVDHGEMNHIALYENNSKIAGCNRYQYKNDYDYFATELEKYLWQNFINSIELENDHENPTY